MELITTTVDLDQTLIDLCNLLQIPRPPSIKWAKRDEIFADGIYCRKTDQISISTSVPHEAIGPLIAHELCHAVLQRAGYRSVGHSAIFMATNQLLLLKAGLEGSETIEGIASRNWSRWTPWPYWYRHILEAQGIYSKLSSRERFVESSAAQTIAYAVLELKLGTYGKFTPKWAAFRWHEIIADTRGPWFALQDVCRALLALSFLMMLSPFLQLKKLAIVPFGLCVIGLLMLSRKFKDK